MTHKELLKKIDLSFKDIPVDYGQADTHKALRAVVELHKPGSEPENSPFKEHCKACNKVYPCKTIQAIEKELK